MKWRKRNPEFNTIKEIVLANNPGISEEELLDDKTVYKIKDIDKVINVLRDAKLKDIFITVVGDYDADGVTSSSEWEYILKSLGIRHRIRLPKRHSEGYGLNLNIIDEIDEGILITVDNGIAAIEAIKKAKEKGIYVIIVDHHMPVLDEDKNKILPEADIIIDPHAIEDQADFVNYCGAGLTYKIAEELFMDDEAILNRLSCFAAIGTVADVVELRKDNRKIVKKGLENLLVYKSRTTGLGKLLEQCYISKRITADDIGYSIGPAINACGRLGAPVAPKEADQAMEMICFNGSLTTAEDMAKDMILVNRERQLQVRAADKKSEQIIEYNAMYGDAPLVIYIPDINEGLIGIIAGHLTEKYNVPSIVFTDSHKDITVLKASGRSVKDVHLKQLLDSCSNDLLGYGGHPGAAGLSIKKEKLDEFREHIQENIGEFSFEPEELMYDLEIQESEVESMIEELDKYGPYGEGNPEPIFLIRDYHLFPKDNSMFKVSGSENEHVRFFGLSTYANAFFQNQKYIELGQPKNLNIIGTLDVSYFNGNTSFGLKVLDMEAIPEPIKERTSLAEMVRKKTIQINKEKGIN
ncbi:single-stranded-DNA-specific exonuclease RecJ [Lacrimispora amygdalina]|uniref:single-stranded-DNA-specific exonuclease RecJ n=1 Tax=Lacrimispora amygdalina TaxID=253257 RepID=UPI000BE33328|nr:DHH family phosphoesterase [Lacrimispora amygdalina]